MDLYTEFIKKFLSSFVSKSDKGIEIAKFGLAFIGKNVSFNDERDRILQNVLKHYRKGEEIFKEMFSKISQSSEADKNSFYSPQMSKILGDYLQVFKEAWLMRECDFLFREDEELRSLVWNEVIRYLRSEVKPSKTVHIGHLEENNNDDNVEVYHQMMYPGVKSGGTNTFTLRNGPYFSS